MSSDQKFKPVPGKVKSKPQEPEAEAVPWEQPEVQQMPDE